MPDARPTTEITLLGRSYTIACSPREQEDLERAARYLDRAMQGIHSRGTALSPDKIAIMAALNITHELLQTRAERRDDEAHLSRLSERLGQALDGVEPRRQGQYSEQ